MERVRRPLLLSLLIACASLPALALNPRLTLKVRDATAEQAIAALAKATGVSLDLVLPKQPSGELAPLPPVLAEKAAFDWDNVTLAAALRQLCERYHLQPSRRSGGYSLYPAGAAPLPLPAKLTGLFEKNGTRLFVRSMAVNSRRSAGFMGQPNGFDSSSVVLEVGCRVGAGDADAIAGFANLAARDDQGTLLVAQGGAPQFGGNPGPYPDDWIGYMALTGAHPAARKLEWIEGDLVLYRDYHSAVVEVPLPLPEGGFRREVGGLMLEVLRYSAAGDRSGKAAGPALQARVLLPAAAPGLAAGQVSLLPVLIGASGKVYQPADADLNNVAVNGAPGQGMSLRFPPLPEPAAKALFQLVEKGDPEPALSFRLKDVPLPPPAVFLAQHKSAPTPSGATERPYLDKQGGTLVSRILIGDRAAGEGSLSLGLAMKTGTQWTGLRWLEVDVDRSGAARLPELKPGTYRLLRVYRPREAPPVAGTGRWQNAEVIVEVERGKEAQAPPLRWAAEAKKP